MPGEFRRFVCYLDSWPSSMVLALGVSGSLGRGEGSDATVMVAPWQPEPEPAVQPKQCVAVTIGLRERASRSKSWIVRGRPGARPSLYYTSLALVPGALGCLTRPGLAGTDSETASALAPGPNVFHAHARSDIRCIPSQSVCGPGGSLRPGVLT